MKKAESHYNKEYFDWQKKVGEVGGKINMTKFTPYISPDDIVLDFGCGGGYLLKELNCKKKIAVDVNEHARETCKENNIEEIYESMSEVPADSVDKVITNHALEHVENATEILRQFHRVLKPGGVVVVAVPIDDWRNSKKFVDNDISNHLQTWNTQLFGNCLKVAGFKDIDVRVLTHAWPAKYEKYFETLNRKLFDFVCWLTSIFHRRRQLIAVAKK